METPVQLLEKATAANAELTAKLANAEKAREDAVAALSVAVEAHKVQLASVEAARVKAEGDAKAAADLAAKAESDRNAVQIELATAKETLAGKNFARVAGAPVASVAAVAGSGADDQANPSQYKTKQEALKAYDAVKQDSRAAADFRRQHWAILGLSKPA
jgi:hypothetical protein